MPAIRRTKIVATLGPSCRTEKKLEEMIQAGVNTVRLNFSHGSAEDHIKAAALVRKVAHKLGVTVAVMGDLQGPKIRVSRFKDGPVTLEEGAEFVLDVSMDKNAGTDKEVGVDYPALAEDTSPGDIYLLNDGRIVLEATRVQGPKVFTKVIIGGLLSNNKGINRKGGGLSAGALTEKDRNDIKIAAKIGVDYLAVSFPRSPDDMNEARLLAQAEGLKAGLISKIERAECAYDLELLDRVILASDGCMVARGDLGVEIGDAALIAVQKHLIARCRQLNRLVITATQMMESMIENPMPTRAEVFDVANAVLDGTDAVMLSGESAAGKYPVEAVASMAEVCLGAEKQAGKERSNHRIDSDFETVDETIAISAMFAANHLKGASAIVSLTESGRTARIISRISSKLPIYAVSVNPDTLARCALYRGVIPVSIKLKDKVPVTLQVLEHLHALGHINPEDKVVLTRGSERGHIGGSDTVRITSLERIKG